MCKSVTSIFHIWHESIDEINRVVLACDNLHVFVSENVQVYDKYIYKCLFPGLTSNNITGVGEIPSTDTVTVG